MGRRIYRELSPVRTRLWAFGIIRASAWGLLASALAAAAIALWRVWANTPISPTAWVTVLACGPLLGLLAGLFRFRMWESAAHAVDTYYGLKDRAATALAFLRHPNPTLWHELQLADAAEHLATVEPRKVVPFRLPKLVPIAVLLSIAAMALTFIPLTVKKAVAAPAPPRAETVAMAKETQERQKALDELIKQENDEKLDALMKEMKLKIAELMEAGVDQKEELAKLSEMQAAIAAQQAQMNVGLVDGQLASLGEALSAADATAAAGQALQDAKFEQAAKELEKLEDAQFDKKEANSLEEKLKQVAKAMGDAGLGQMGESASMLAEGIKNGSRSKISNGAKGLAQGARKQARRRRISRMLDAELESLAECKNPKNGGPKGLAKNKSKSPSNTWGRMTAGNIEGEKTNLLAKREIKEITGDPDENGPSEMETTHSPEGRQQAARKEREAYNKAVKQAEAVLESEPIPLGHRQTIRKYFELIRPQNDDGSAKALKDAAAKGEK